MVNQSGNNLNKHSCICISLYLPSYHSPTAEEKFEAPQYCSALGSRVCSWVNWQTEAGSGNPNTRSQGQQVILQRSTCSAGLPYFGCPRLAGSRHIAYWVRICNSSTGILSLPGASVRHSAHDKGHEEGGSAYSKAGSSLRSPPGNSRASIPKTRVCLLSALCFHLHLWLYGGLSPTTSLWKKS